MQNQLHALLAWRLTPVLAGACAVVALAAPAIASDYCGRDFPIDANPTPVTEADVCNFHKVDDDLYRGGRPRPTAFPKFVQLGIRTVIDLEEAQYAKAEQALIDDLNGKLPPEKRLDFISFPVGPSEIEVTGISHERMQKLFGALRDARGPTFIHCYHGRDRVGAVVAIYRMRMQEELFEQAFQEATHYFFPQDSQALKRTIDRYQSAKKLDALPLPRPAQ